VIRYIMWGLFILFTLGLVDVHVQYEDGLYLEYNSRW
jgi:hypothetical protein